MVWTAFPALKALSDALIVHARTRPSLLIFTVIAVAIVLSHEMYMKTLKKASIFSVTFFIVFSHLGLLEIYERWDLSLPEPRAACGCTFW